MINFLLTVGSSLRNREALQCFTSQMLEDVELNSDQLEVSSGRPPSEDSVKDNWLKSQLKLSRSLISAGVLHGATPGSRHFEGLLSVFSSLSWTLLSFVVHMPPGHFSVPPSVTFSPGHRSDTSSFLGLYFFLLHLSLSTVFFKFLSYFYFFVLCL